MIYNEAGRNSKVILARRRELLNRSVDNPLKLMDWKPNIKNRADLSEEEDSYALI